VPQQVALHLEEVAWVPRAQERQEELPPQVALQSPSPVQSLLAVLADAAGGTRAG
jgi:hypothetical protein